MNPLAFLALFTFSVFLFLAGYTARLWLPPENLISPEQKYFASPLTSSWTTTLVGNIESVSEVEMTVRDSAGIAEPLRVRFHDTVEVQQVVQRADEKGTVQTEEIALRDLKSGDRVIVSVQLGRDSALYATRIDKIVTIVP